MVNLTQKAIDGSNVSNFYLNNTKHNKMAYIVLCSEQSSVNDVAMAKRKG